jgi:hypothetical protein
VIDDPVLPIGNPSEPAAAEDNGKPGKKVGGLASFQGADGTSPSSAGRGSAPGGKKGKGKTKIGRPPKNGAGFSEEKISEVVDDPEIEAARAEFEDCLVELLVATTVNLADAKFEVLKLKYPEAVARGLADKFLLTEKEKKYFGGVAVRLWRKYLGDKYLFTDEAIAGVYLLQYLMRNLEGLSQSRKIEKEKNETVKRPGLQSETPPSDRSVENGKVHANGAVDSPAPR